MPGSLFGNTRIPKGLLILAGNGDLVPPERYRRRWARAFIHNKARYRTERNRRFVTVMRFTAMKCLYLYRTLSTSGDGFHVRTLLRD